jgi:hypothetical protein
MANSGIKTLIFVVPNKANLKYKSDLTYKQQNEMLIETNFNYRAAIILCR